MVWLIIGIVAWVVIGIISIYYDWTDGCDIKVGNIVPLFFFSISIGPLIGLIYLASYLLKNIFPSGVDADKVVFRRRG